MKKFLRDLSVFFGFFLILFHLYPEYLFQTKKYFYNIGTEIFLAVEKSEQTSNMRITKLYLGDSVDEQLLNTKPIGKNELKLSTNQAITMVGQFILLHNVTENKNKIDTLELRIHPFGLGNNLNNPLTYNYFLKPFYKEKYKSQMSNSVITQVEKIPFYYLSQYRPVLTSMWSPNYAPEEKLEPISKINLDYLYRIKKICDSHKIKLIIRAVPINEVHRLKINEFIDFVNNKKIALLYDYTKTITYLPNNYFIPDQIHLKTEYLSHNLY